MKSILYNQPEEHLVYADHIVGIIKTPFETRENEQEYGDLHESEIDLSQEISGHRFNLVYRYNRQLSSISRKDSYLIFGMSPEDFKQKLRDTLSESGESDFEVSILVYRKVEKNSFDERLKNFFSSEKESSLKKSETKKNSSKTSNKMMYA